MVFAAGINPSSVMDATNAERQVLEAEAETEKCIRDLAVKRRKLNALLPIASLPPEILADIFLDFSVAWRRKHVGQPGEPAARRWIRIAHVCHYWRETCLSTPHLWTDIYGNNLAWTRMLLERSQQAPIQARLWVDTSLDSWKESARETILH